MKFAELNTGAKMPMLGLGVYRFENAEGKKAIHTALEAGYRSIDTAAAYENEKLVGEVLRESKINRAEIFVTTKLSNPAQRENKIEEEFAASLENLGLDFVDLYLMHWPVPEKFCESWRVMQKFFFDGRAKAFGVSNFLPRHLSAIFSDENAPCERSLSRKNENATVIPAVNQIELHPRLTQKPLLEACREKNIAPQSWSPLGGG
ncbi:MAG: aldo/keto reductase, partial [Defluviitaleaceae bacterium]|nr:aldo/keto reductase [Defluviitaleaceae bacterium]